jgi:hypothetical protein
VLKPLKGMSDLMIAPQSVNIPHCTKVKIFQTEMHLIIEFCTQTQTD